MNSLPALMSKIDSIDGQIIDLLQERFSCSRRIGEMKLQHGEPLFDPIRVAAQRQKFIFDCMDVGLNADMAMRLITTIVDQVLDERRLLTDKLSSLGR